MAPTLVTGRDGEIVTIPGVPTRIKRLRPVERAEEESTYMPSAEQKPNPQPWEQRRGRGGSTPPLGSNRETGKTT